MKRVAVLGSGEVGDVLANGFLAHGWAVTRGSRDPAKLAEWLAAAGPNAATGTFAQAAAAGELVVLAVKGAAALDVLDLVGPDALAGKVVIDTTNAIADAPPVNGVLLAFTGPNESLMERLQAHVPRARFVKAFSCVGAALMVDPKLPGGKPSMFIAGNDEAARAEVTRLLHDFGWEVEDCGAAEAARAIEPMAILWCIAGFRQDDWVHAYRVLRA